MIGYKAFGPGWVCKGFQYEIGKIYELPKGQTLKICECGFHFCKNPIDVFGFYPLREDTLIAKVEALGDIQQEGIKFVTNKIRIVREFARVELQLLIRDGDYNTGFHNTGIRNSGNHNTGNYNSGNRNTGEYNAGARNTGNNNRGFHNTGNNNFGSSNSGDYNFGSYNSGSFNSGLRNAGYYNAGDYNSGAYNSGDYNAGIFNSGCHNAGIFNSNEPCMRMFNRDTGMTYSKFTGTLSYDLESLLWRIHKKDLITGDVEKIKALPNFDPIIFEKITGIKIDEVKV